MTEVGSWPSGISAITAFVEDLDAAKRFYGEVFGLPVAYEDDASAVFNFGNTVDQPAEDRSGARSDRACSGRESATPEPAFSSRSPSKTWMRCARSWSNAEWSC